MANPALLAILERAQRTAKRDTLTYSRGIGTGAVHERVVKGLDSMAPPVVKSSSMRGHTQPKPKPDSLPPMVELCTIPDDGFFKLPLWLGGANATLNGWSYGQKLYGNQSRVRVRLLGGQQQVVFDDRDGHSRQFESSGIAEVSYPTCLMVVRLNDNEADTVAHPVTEREGDMSTLNAAQEKALRKRFEFASGQLDKATEAKDAGKIEVATKRIEAIAVEAENAGIDLAAEAEAAPAAAPSADKAAVAKLKATPKKGEAKVAKAKKLPSTQNCLCGCQLETGGKFRPGHDARVKGWLKEVEMGKKKLSELPEPVQAVVKFAGKAATAGKEGSDYRIVQSPVKFPGRDDIKVV